MNARIKEVFVKKLLFVSVSVLLSVSCAAAAWSGSLFGKRLGDSAPVSPDAEKCLYGLPIDGFVPEKLFLDFTVYALWVTPATDKVAAIVAVAEIDDDPVAAKVLRKKAATLVTTKFPEAKVEEGKDGDITLTMDNKDIVAVEIVDGNVIVQAIRPALLQRGIAEFGRQVNAGAWKGRLFGATLGDPSAVPAGAETSEAGLPIVAIEPDRPIDGFGAYAAWITPSSKKIALICAVAEIDKDNDDPQLIRGKTARLLKAMFPEARDKEDKDGDWTLTMDNGDVIGVEISGDSILVQAIRPALLQQGIFEFNQKVSSDRDSLDAL